MNPMHQKMTKKERERREGLETNLYVRSSDAPCSPSDFKKLPRMPVSVILDNLRSAFNVGSMIRTADCVRAEKIHFCGYTAHPPHTKLEKTSLGALPYVPWTYHTSVVEALRTIKENNRPVIAMETTNQSHGLWEYAFPFPCALIFGNEALGISKSALRMADDIVEIPMMGYKNSINVAVAFGIVAYEIQRQHWNKIEAEWQIRRPNFSGGIHENKNCSAGRHSD